MRQHRSFRRSLLLYGMVALSLIVIMGTIVLADARPVLAATHHPLKPHTSGNETIVLVKGWQDVEGKDVHLPGAPKWAPDSCKSYWQDLIPYLQGIHEGQSWGFPDNVKTVGIYSGDQDCDANLNPVKLDNAPIKGRNIGGPDNCQTYYPTDIDPTVQGPDQKGTDGTVNESIYRLSCFFAWYIHDNFAEKSIDIVAHSMGGLIVRNAIYQVQNRVALGTVNIFPETLGQISQVITIATPHGGTTGPQGFWAAKNDQGKEMASDSSFMQEMINHANSPNTNSPGVDSTRWTLIGSDCDLAVSNQSALTMTGTTSKITYAPKKVGGNVTRTCYAHTDYFHLHPGAGDDGDGIINTDNADAPMYYCQANSTCDSNSFAYTDTGPEGMLAIWRALWGENVADPQASPQSDQPATTQVSNVSPADQQSTQSASSSQQCFLWWCW